MEAEAVGAKAASFLNLLRGLLIFEVLLPPPLFVDEAVELMEL